MSQMQPKPGKRIQRMVADWGARHGAPLEPMLEEAKPVYLLTFHGKPVGYARTWEKSQAWTRRDPARACQLLSALEDAS